jgi:hypothetical protein
MAEAALFERLGGRGRFQAAEARLVGRPADDPATAEEAVAELRVTVKDPDPAKVGRAFSGAAIELALASYPGCYTTTPPGDATPYGVYWPALVRADLVDQVAVLDNGRRLPIKRTPPGPTPDPPGPTPAPPAPTPEPPAAAPGPPVGERSPPPELGSGVVHNPPTPVAAPPGPALPGPALPGPTVRVPLGRVFGARSGDKGGTANVGVWARDAAGYAFLAERLTVERFRELIPEARDLEVRRYELPNLLAVNLVVVGLLGEGVSSTTRIDPQAKGLGEWLRARVVELPAELLDTEGG